MNAEELLLYLDNLELTPTELRLLLHITVWVECDQSAETLSERLHISRKAVFKDLDSLVAKGHVTKKSRWRQTSIYRPKVWNVQNATPSNDGMSKTTQDLSTPSCTGTQGVSTDPVSKSPLHNHGVPKTPLHKGSIWNALPPEIRQKCDEELRRDGLR